MAMYYYASKISAIACGTRCKKTVLQKSRGQRDRDKLLLLQQQQQQQNKHHQIELYEDGNNILHKKYVSLDDLDNNKIEINYNEVSSSTNLKSKEFGTTITSMESNIRNRKKGYFNNKDINLECSVLGTGGIMYVNGKIISGPLDSLVDVLVPEAVNELDKEYIFSFLLSSRLFIRPHELLGKLLSSVPDNESLSPLVGLLGIWTNKFPYDFRDERIMNHVKHIVAKCSNTGLEELVSEMLSALLKRLTELEKHEEDLRQSQNSEKVESIKSPTSSQFAQILCRAERKLAKHIGPEEFLQCSTNVLLDKHSKIKWDQPSTSSGPIGIQDPKKTCNLESYLEWSARLRLFVCNEILQSNGIKDRSKIVELWSGVAQYCLLVGNYNSATSILESLESPPIARLKVTWSKLSATCQQLDCMQRHAEGCGDLWSKQAILLNENNKIEGNNKNNGITNSMLTTNNTKSLDPGIPGTSADNKNFLTTPTTATASIPENNKIKSNDWVVIPVFSDIVKLALSAREDCLQRLPNGHINMIAFDRLAAIVGAFTKHMSEIKIAIYDPKEYHTFSRHMHSISTLNESELMMASFDCEEPTQAEKLMYDV